MDYMTILLPVILSFIIATGLSWFLFKKFHKREMEQLKEFEETRNLVSNTRGSLQKAEAEKSLLKTEMERKISEATTRGYQDNATKEIELAELKKQIAIKEAEYIKQEAKYIKQIEEQKKIAYDDGCREALKDYKVVCTPFFYYSDGFVFKESIGGYSYRLFVKGIPILEPEHVILERRYVFDKNVKEAIINTVNTTVSLVGKSFGGIPFEALPLIVEKKV